VNARGGEEKGKKPAFATKKPGNPARSVTRGTGDTGRNGPCLKGKENARRPAGGPTRGVLTPCPGKKGCISDPGEGGERGKEREKQKKKKRKPRRWWDEGVDGLEFPFGIGKKEKPIRLLLGKEK